MRILGIDCGTEHTGYGLIESDGRIHRMIVAGCIRTRPKDPLDWDHRLRGARPLTRDLERPRTDVARPGIGADQIGRAIEPDLKARRLDRRKAQMPVGAQDA